MRTSITAVLVLAILAVAETQSSAEDWLPGRWPPDWFRRSTWLLLCPCSSVPQSCGVVCLLCYSGLMKGNQGLPLGFGGLGIGRLSSRVR